MKTTFDRTVFSFPEHEKNTSYRSLVRISKGRPDVPYKMILPQKPLEEIFHDAWEWYLKNLN